MSTHNRPEKEPVCFACEVVQEYTELASNFTQDITQILLGPMWALYLSLAGLWVVIQGLRLVLTFTDPVQAGKDFVFVLIAGFLLSGQGPELVTNIFKVSLAIMGGASGLALEVGYQEDRMAALSGGTLPLTAGMVALVNAAEAGIRNVFWFSNAIMRSGALMDPGPWLSGFLLAIPYFIIIILYLAQVVIAIFRVMMIATFSPFLMLGLGFGWGRDMFKSGFKTLISSFLVLFGATAAVALMLYAVNGLDINTDIPPEDIRAAADITNEKFFVALVMGWIGSGLLFETTSIANSIAGSVLSNTAAMTMTAGVSTSAGLLMKNPVSRALAGSALGAAGNAVESVASKAAQGTGYAAGFTGHHASQTVQDLVNKAKNYSSHKDNA